MLENSDYKKLELLYTESIGLGANAENSPGQLGASTITTALKGGIGGDFKSTDTKITEKMNMIGSMIKHVSVSKIKPEEISQAFKDVDTLLHKAVSRLEKLARPSGTQERSDLNQPV